MRKAVTLGVLAVVAVLISGCYSTHHGIFLDDDLNAYLAVGFTVDPYTVGTNELQDLSSRVALLFPELAGRINVAEGSVTIMPGGPVPIHDLPFVEMSESDSGTRISIALPALVTATDYKDEPKGADMELIVVSSRRIVDANTFDIGDLPDGLCLASWKLTAKQLSKPVTLWIVVE